MPIKRLIQNHYLGGQVENGAEVTHPVHTLKSNMRHF
jgi:hypothetical protein